MNVYEYSAKVNYFQDTLQGRQAAPDLIAASELIKQQYALEYDVPQDQVEIFSIVELEQNAQY